MSQNADGKLTPGERVRIRSDRWTILSVTRHADCQALATAGCGTANSNVRRTFLLPFDRVLAASHAPRVRVMRPRRWAHHVTGHLLSNHPFGSLCRAASADIELLPYQLEPALAMMRHARLRVLIADQVGLGKTVQAGILLNELAHQEAGFRSMILTPAGLREQWQRELASRFSLEATIADTAWLFERTRDLPPDVNPWALPGIYVASLDLVKRPEVLRALENVAWDLTVIDEVHGAGAGTARLAAAEAIGARSRRLVLLTATPPDGDPVQFDAIAGVGRSGGGAPITVFRRTRADTGLGPRRKSVVLTVRLAPEEQAMHRLLERYTALVWREATRRQDGAARLAAVILRKRALSSAASLAQSVTRRLAALGAPPPAVERQLTLPLADEDPLPDEAPDAVFGASGLGDVALERAYLEEIAAAAARAAERESKLRWLVRLLGRIAEPAVVFTEYRDTLAQIAASLADRHRPLLLHGGLSPRERSAAQSAFNRSGTVLLSTDAASEGLNLHERCRLVVHFELPWTPMRLEQRTGRVDRLGQTRPVHEVLMVARDTAERLVLAPLLKRARRASTLRGSASALDESRIAETIVGGTAAPENGEPVRPAATVTVDLRDEANREARRVSLHRRLALAGRANPRGSLDDTAVTVRRGLPRRGLLVVVALSLTDAGGHRLHGEIIPVTMNGRGLPRTRHARTVSEWAVRYLQDRGERIRIAARAHTAPSLGEAMARAGALSDALAEREREIAAEGRSMARTLVQAGLFDRRAINLASARHEAATSLIEDTQIRLLSLESGATLQLEARIVAIRVPWAASR